MSWIVFSSHAFRRLLGLVYFACSFQHQDFRCVVICSVFKISQMSSSCNSAADGDGTTGATKEYCLTSPSTVSIAWNTVAPLFLTIEFL